MSRQKITNSEKETFNLAKNYARQLQGGEIIGLIGELGAGKTIFVKGLATGLGIKRIITSPTFVLMKIYKIRNSQFAIQNLCHIDCYRIKDGRDIASIGAEEYFNRPDIVTVIEWADKIKKILPKKTKYVKIKYHQENNKRIINF